MGSTAPEQAWVVKQPGPWKRQSSGTTGNLVFGGTAGGNFEGLSGRHWGDAMSTCGAGAVMAGPVSICHQWRTIRCGACRAREREKSHSRSGRVRNISHMLVFKLGGTATLPAVNPFQEPGLVPPYRAGRVMKRSTRVRHYFQRYCAACHGDVAVSGGVLPDLRYSSTLSERQQVV